MNQDFKPDIDDDPMESFFDKLMSEQEASDFLARSKNDDSFQSQWALQQKIDASLKDVFTFQTPNLPQTEIKTPDATRDATETGVFSRWVRLAIAASLLGVIAWGAWQYSDNGSRVVFQPVALNRIYDQTVESGFKPYYECHDMQRFASTFEHRHGVALTLAKMPDDRRMLGLSYPGGLTRGSTAMLCEVREQPVMVFVDTVENDRDELFEVDSGSHVFRSEKFGLVFYEVSPLAESTMTQFFELAKKDLISEEPNSAVN